MDSALRPRDIQARIRAGESPEDVAAAAQTTVEAIMPFAGPVIAERQHVAQMALKGSLRRRQGENTTAARTLGEAAELFFHEHSLHDEDVEWDAWRRPDGRWVLVASYVVGGRPRTAEFTHDQPGRYVVAENDDAKILTGELREPGTATSAPTPQARRLSPVPHQDELPLGDDAIELVRDRQPEVEPVTAPDPIADTADADWLTQSPPRPGDDDVPLIEEPTAAGSQPDPVVPVAPVDAPAEEAANEEQESQEDEDTVAVKRAASRRKGRSSVPSWDEIMFGGSTTDD